MSRAPAASFRSPTGEALSFGDVAARAAGRPVLLAFFKTTCPTCRLAWPYLERLAGRHGTNLHVVGVSQDDAGASRAFYRENGDASFPLMLDPAPAYEASDAWGVDAVPHFALVEPDGTVSKVWEGWQRGEMEAIAARFGGDSGAPLLAADDPVPAWKAG